MSAYDTEFGFETDSDNGQYEQESQETHWADEAEYEGEAIAEQLLSRLDGGDELDVVDESELAAELLAITDDDELDEFVGRLVSRAARGARQFARSSAGRALGGALKGVARKALPVVGGAVGSMVAPGVGTAIGSKLGSMASNLFEVDLGSMADDEAEFEVARRFVRLANDATRQAVNAPRGMPPQQVAQRALVSAARRHAPGLARAAGGGGGGRGGGGGGGRRRSGTWNRKGSTIVVHGV